MLQIKDNLYHYKDSCNVYIIKYNRSAILIDLGSGDVLEELSDIGVEKVDAVYFTVPRRDRTAGIDKLSSDTKIFWPDGAGDYIKEFSLIDSENPVIHPRFPGIYEVSRFRDIEYNRAEIATYGGMRLSLIPATESKCGFSYTLDTGKEIICFSGDCLYSAGKFYHPYNMEHMHHTGTGQREAANAIYALVLVRPDILCPAHGDVIKGYDNVLDVLKVSHEKLLKLSEPYFNSCLNTPAAERISELSEANGFKKLGEKMYMKGNTHVLLSKSGNAMLVDFNCWNEEVTAEWVNEFKEFFGDSCQIEKVLITHRHFDHWIGINELRNHFDISVECIYYMADDMENPLARKRPFSHIPGVKIDKRLNDSEKFEWHEYTFTAYYFPGQTDMHSGYFTEACGLKLFYSGDNFYPPQQWGGTGGFSSFNGGDPKRGWLKSINLLLELEPDYILCGHGHPYVFNKEEFINRREWVKQITSMMEEGSPFKPYELNFDQHVFEVMPYIQKAEEEFSIKFIFKNFDKCENTITVKPVLPEGVECKQTGESVLKALSESLAEIDFTFKKTGKLQPDKMITFDITYNDCYIGEKVEAFVY